MRWKKELHEGKYPALVTPKLFKRVQEVLERRNRLKPKVGFLPFPFRGIFRCSCGAMITAQIGRGRGGNYRYYRCTRKKGPCSEPYIQQSELALELALKLRPLRLPPHYIQEMEKMLEAAKDRLRQNSMRIATELGNRLGEVKEELSRLTTLHLQTRIEDETYYELNEKYLTKKSALKAEISAFEKEPTENWFEPMQELITTLKLATDSEVETNFLKIAEFAKRTGSNPTISRKRVTISFTPIYNSVALLTREIQSAKKPSSSQKSLPKTVYPALRRVFTTARTR